MKKEIISTTKAPSAVGTYSQGVKLDHCYYFSGQIGLCPMTMELQPGFEAQLKQILNNIDGLLESQNITRENIIKTTIFLTDLENFPIVNRYYEDFFLTPYPARSCVEVSRLPKDSLVEIEVIASDC